MQPEQRCSAVKLVDVFAVMLIILGMVIALRPVFLKAHDNDTIACANNLKQIGLGMIEYVQDYDGKWPGGAGHWAGDLYPYEKSPKVYKCPSDTVTFASGDEVSYALNTNLQGLKGGNSIAALSLPARTVAAIEYDGTPALLDWSNDRESKVTSGKGKNTAWGNAVLGRVPPVAPLRHDPYINVLACDGHVQKMIASEISSGRDAATATSPQTVGGAAGTGALGTDFAITFSEM